MKIRTILLIVSAVAIAVLAALYMANPSFDSKASSDSKKSNTASLADTYRKDRPGDREILVDPTKIANPTNKQDVSTPNPPLTPDEAWKERLHTLLTNDTLSDRELGRELLAIAADGKTPAWARVHAMANALNFTNDTNYAEDIKPLAMRLVLPEPVNDVILDDLINRDPAEILPVAREIAAVPRHPLAGAIGDFVKGSEESLEE